MKTSVLTLFYILLCMTALMEIQACSRPQGSPPNPTSNQAADQKIQEQITTAILSMDRPSIVSFGIGGGGRVLVTDGNVTLLGTVVSESDRLAVGQTAREFAGVKEVSNLLAVWPEASYRDSHKVIQLKQLSNWPFEAPQPAGLRSDAPYK